MNMKTCHGAEVVNMREEDWEQKYKEKKAHSVASLLTGPRELAKGQEQMS
ncbi:hypothetical protein E2C01_073737 [Portunus trituberculatus]|uniref:Uncharacterized protein n=1 Tax=Portunus trituberculatus TaxID=210409 RepID=A0A5B7I1I6_PORTR|nr:hypothetical protein [Portunus trituberculatus]